jgi:hypothetical protein
VQLADSGLGDRGAAGGLGAQPGMRAMTAMDSAVSLELEPRQQRVYASVEARFQITEPPQL